MVSDLDAANAEANRLAKELDDGTYWASWKEVPADGADPAGVTSHL